MCVVGGSAIEEGACGRTGLHNAAGHRHREAAQVINMFQTNAIVCLERSVSVPGNLMGNLQNPNPIVMDWTI